MFWNCCYGYNEFFFKFIFDIGLMNKIVYSEFRLCLDKIRVNNGSIVDFV